jgi:glutathione S-transferase
MLRLLGRATSGNVQKVIFLLEELGLPYEREDYGRQFNNTATPEYGKLNPTRKVPTLVDGDVVVWESHSILRYLATKAGSALYPADPAKRSQVDRWMDWGLASLNPVFLAGFREAKKEPAERRAAVGEEIAAELKILEGQLAQQPFLTGNALSIADIALAPLVSRCLNFPLGLPKFPALEAWRGRLKERPAFVKATAAG